MYKLIALFLVVIISSTVINCENVKELPYCPEKDGSPGMVLVSTLDGKLSALNTSGALVWQIETGPGPLLVSNIHKLELTNNGEWIRIIPSLSGTLYKFDGQTIDPIPISADSLLKSSFRYSDDLVIAGGIEVRTYGVGFQTGKLFYECTPLKCSNDKEKNADDVLLIERSTQTIRAVEPRTGNERWNFSVGLHNIKLPEISCIDTSAKLFDWNITTVLPEGILRASSVKNNIESAWQYKFNAPIVHVWHWNGRQLIEINLFAPKHNPKLIVITPHLPAIYLGMHKKQLYIHESVVMQSILQGRANTALAVTDSKSLAKIPWNPVSASDTADIEDDSTALSVLNGSEYVNGNGYYLYTSADVQEKETQICSKNNTIEDTKKAEVVVEEEIFEDIMVVSYVLPWWKEVVVIFITTILFNLVVLRVWNKRHQIKELVIVEPPASIERRISEQKTSESDQFTSRYMEDFDTIQCLGKGGFGVVFEVKQKIDECSYAIKRITLPNGESSRERVMREVKALAKLDHQNIVRYFCSWVEHPPLDWNKEHDLKWMADLNSFMSSFMTESTRNTDKFKRSKSASVSIDIYNKFTDDYSFHSRDQNSVETDSSTSFIVFENDDKSTSTEKSLVETSKSTFADETINSQSTISSGIDCTISSISEHIKKKVNWRRPSRKHHSWDVSQNEITLMPDEEPPVFLYIQMQLCKKDSLKEWLSASQERDYKKSLDIFLQILSAVEYVHLRGLIHRDLKPSNIFFSLDGQIKVGDFGLVKDMEDCLELDSRLSSFSSRGHTREVGTQLYMSPEQSNSRLYDYKVDIYALGLIFFELLVPFGTDMERIDTLTKLKKHQYPNDFPEKYPDEYDLLKNMLCDDPSKRLTTIGIRSRPPYSIKDPSYTDDYHFRLPNFPKNLNLFSSSS